MQRIYANPANCKMLRWRLNQGSNTHRRNPLREDIIEAVIGMKSWQADGGIVSFKDTDQVHCM